MNKNALYVLLALGAGVILLGGVAVYRLRPSETTAPVPMPVPDNSASPAPETAVISTVEYTDSGFSPATLTIRVGATVQFINKTTRPMWVASNPHPVHTDLPGFDSLSASSTYSYTFTKPGTWAYHNHLNPSSTGQVVVTD